jgi:hypothetical protein
VETLGRAAEARFFSDGAKDLEPEILHGDWPSRQRRRAAVMAARANARCGATAVYRLSQSAREAGHIILVASPGRSHDR